MATSPRHTPPAPETASEAADPAGGRSARKRRAILAAAAEAFLQSGYLGASVDEIAAAAEVSKQTIYKQFASKEALFVAVVASLTNAGSDAAHREAPPPERAEAVAAYLCDYALRQLKVVLSPGLLQLRRMVIGETGRFPELGQALYDGGPGRAIKTIAGALDELARRGFLAIDDPMAAAAQFNWLVMGDPVNRAMFLGDGSVPDARGLRRHVDQAVRVFLAAYGRPAQADGP